MGCQDPLERQPIREMRDGGGEFLHSGPESEALFLGDRELSLGRQVGVRAWFGIRSETRASPYRPPLGRLAYGGSCGDLEAEFEDPVFLLSKTPRNQETRQLWGGGIGRPLRFSER